LGIVPLINAAIRLRRSIMDFIAYNKLNNLNSFDTYKTMQFAAIMEIITILSSNVISLVFGIITLSYINNENVIKFLKEKGIY